MPKCSKYHAKWQILVPNCCKYKANDTKKESQKKPKSEPTKNQKLFWTRFDASCFTFFCEPHILELLREQNPICVAAAEQSEILHGKWRTLFGEVSEVVASQCAWQSQYLTPFDVGGFCFPQWYRCDKWDTQGMWHVNLCGGRVTRCASNSDVQGLFPTKVWTECPIQMFDKVSNRSVWQTSPQRVSYKSVLQGCIVGVSHEHVVSKEYLTKQSYWGAFQKSAFAGWLTGCYKTVPQECPTKECPTKECPTKVSCTVPQERLRGISHSIFARASCGIFAKGCIYTSVLIKCFRRSRLRALHSRGIVIVVFQFQIMMDSCDVHSCSWGLSVFTLHCEYKKCM